MEGISNVKEGYMFVQSTRLRHWRTYKAKYFILTNECLYCFHRRGDLTSIPRDVIHLEDISVALDETRRGLRRRYFINLGAKHSKRTYNVFCFTSEERNSWFTAIMQVLAGKYTDKIVRETSKANTFVEWNNRRSYLTSLERQRPKSLSCLDLTNLNVMSENNPTPTPIRNTFAGRLSGKLSSSSLDIAIRTTNSTYKHNNNKKPEDITTLTGQYFSDTSEFVTSSRPSSMYEMSLLKRGEDFLSRYTSVKRLSGKHRVSHSLLTEHAKISPVCLTSY